MESAEIIQRGNLKFTGYPVFVLGEGGAGGDWGVALRGGYGFTERLDGELAVALYDGATLFGGNLEVALLRARRMVGGVDLSARGGVHQVQGDAADATGLDLAALLSTRVTQPGAGRLAGLQPELPRRAAAGRQHAAPGAGGGVSPQPQSRPAGGVWRRAERPCRELPFGGARAVLPVDCPWARGGSARALAPERRSARVRSDRPAAPVALQADLLRASQGVVHYPDHPLDLGRAPTETGALQPVTLGNGPLDGRPVAEIPGSGGRVRSFHGLSHVGQKACQVVFSCASGSARAVGRMRWCSWAPRDCRSHATSRGTGRLPRTST